MTSEAGVSRNDTARGSLWTVQIVKLFNFSEIQLRD